MDPIKKMLAQLGKDSKKRAMDALGEKITFSAWDYLRSGEPEFAATRLENLAESLTGVDAIAVKQAAADLRASSAGSDELMPELADSHEEAISEIQAWIADLQDRVASLEAGKSRGRKKENQSEE